MSDMEVLLVGGGGSFLNAIVDKLNKEGHRIYVLTEKHSQDRPNRKVFEYYYFSYESDSLGEVLESINPDVMLCMGAFDTGFSWTDARREAVRYSAGMTNLMMVYAMRGKGRFIYLSSQEVYNSSYPNDIEEDEPATARGARAMIFAQMEQLCMNYSLQMSLDMMVLRLDHLYETPRKKDEATHIAAKLCLEGLKTGKISANGKNRIALLHKADAVEFIYTCIACQKHEKQLYHLSSSLEISEMEIAEIIQKSLDSGIEIIDNSVGYGYRIVLSNQAFASEFGLRLMHKPQEELAQMAKYMKRHQSVFLTQEDSGDSLWRRIYQKTAFLIRAVIPFVENMICFIPFFMLNNRSVGSRYFAKMDFFLLYVLLFAIVYGQQQATFSAVLATAGYIFRQMYQRSGFDVMLDYNTYVWIAQLFILGLVVGHMKDHLAVLKNENKQEVNYLSGQITDIQDINDSNARMKNVLVNQLIHQTDSLGKVYQITSSLDQYEPEEVLFYAAEVVAKLMDSKDVAVYAAANQTYARLYSSTSKKARSLGNSIRFTEMGDMSLAFQERRVYINKTLDERYPLMARAIYVDDEVRLMIMVWGIPWERMTLTQADMLSVISYLIQNSTLKANRYLEALEDRRYIKGTNVMEEAAFQKLSEAYLEAKNRGLTDCTMLRIQSTLEDKEEQAAFLQKTLRQSDYLGEQDGILYVLLANTGEDMAQVVRDRLETKGIQSTIVKKGEK